MTDTQTDSGKRTVTMSTATKQRFNALKRDGLTQDAFMNDLMDAFEEEQNDG